jgi:ABC-type polysaccharide/polyol phosphate transport system ATPase subunit
VTAPGSTLLTAGSAASAHEDPVSVLWEQAGRAQVRADVLRAVKKKHPKASVIPWLEAMSALRGDTDPEGSRLRAVLDALGRRLRSRVVLPACPMGSEDDARETLARGIAEGSAPPVADGARILLEAVEETRSQLRFVNLPRSSGLLVHAWIEVESALDQRFQLRLWHEGADEEEALRFRLRGITVDGHFTIPLATRPARLYTLVLQDELLTIYVDGVLLWQRKRRRGALPVDGLVLDLSGSTGLTSRVSIQGLRVETFDEPFPGLGDDDELLARGRAATLLAEHKDQELHSHLHRLQLLSLASLQPAVEELLGRLGKSAGYLDWLGASVTERLPAPAQQEWRARLTATRPEPVIQVEGLRVVLSSNPARDWSLGRMLSGEKRRNLNILDGLDFEIFHGDVLAIIGRNGAGKSTLLRTLSGSVPIQAGRVRVQGQHVLLRPGAGMREDLSGRDNITLAGIYMGLSFRQIRDIMDEVIDFSELRDDIDRPYKYYSDGMRSRLIFSLATSTSPDILMLDELLGAGDIGFQEKAMKRLDRFIENAKVVIVVQHGMDFVLRRCNKALLIDRGRQVYFGSPEVAAELYTNGMA